MVYIHIPFCKTFCTYCDFYSEICTERSLRQVQNYTEELCAEIDRRREEIDEARALSVNTLYFGGGTPSILPSDNLKKIVECLGYDGYDEFTVEVNPDDIVAGGAQYVEALLSMGVNRISMGVQSFDDAMLKWMNRRHTASQVAEAFQILRSAGVDNISVDLIFGITHLDDSVWLDTVRQAIDMHPEHISAYQLSIEEGSALASMVAKGTYVEADDEQCRKQYELLCDELSRANYKHYEISNFAKPGREAIHNSAYWRRLPYVGLGPGAHSLRIGETQVRSWNSQQPSGWKSSFEVLSQEEIREERIMLGLRTKEGIDGMSIPESKWFVSDDIISTII